MSFRAQISPAANRQLTEIQNYTAEAASLRTAERFTDDIIARCESLAELPRRGWIRRDLHPSIYFLAFRRRAVVAYRIDGDHVTILGIFRGGQDYEAILATWSGF